MSQHSHAPTYEAEPQAPRATRLLDASRIGDHVDRLYRAAWALTGSKEDAEDLVQETYARVLARPRLVRDSDDLGYLLVTLRNTFLSGKRKESRRLRTGPIPEHVEVAEERASGDPHSMLEAGSVYAAVAALPEKLRNVLVAVDVTGLSYGEAAHALRIPKGTVMSRLSRARGRVVLALAG